LPIEQNLSLNPARAGDTDAQPVNCALNQPALQSSVAKSPRVQRPQDAARGANNGDRAAAGCRTAEEDAPWWQVDLIFNTVIERVVIYDGAEAAHRLRFFSLLASADGLEWQSFHHWTAAEKPDGPEAAAFIVTPKKPVLARFIRLQRNRRGILHFRECEVYGHSPTQNERLKILTASAERDAALRASRDGFITRIGGFSVFVDAGHYGRRVVAALQDASYEQDERQLTEKMLLPSDRVLEVGTAIGVLSMTAATCTAPAQVLTFDGNPAIIEDAKRNFSYNGLIGINARAGILKNRKQIEPSEKQVKFVVSGNFWSSRLGQTAAGKKATVIDTPVLCLEDEIASHHANVLIVDIEGGEIELLCGADLPGIRLIILEKHARTAGDAATKAMIKGLIAQGFNTTPELSRGDVAAFRRGMGFNERWVQPRLNRCKLALRRIIPRSVPPVAGE
jgi:FkbM family methyltransferase